MVLLVFAFKSPLFVLLPGVSPLMALDKFNVIADSSLFLFVLRLTYFRLALTGFFGFPVAFACGAAGSPGCFC